MPQFHTLSDLPGRNLFSSLLFLSLLSLSLSSLGCATSRSTEAGRDQSLSYLELQVRPTTAEIYIDDEYHGVVEGWRHQTVPIEPGYRRLELRAQNHITQRFDLDINPGELLTLTVRLESSIMPSEQQENTEESPRQSAPALPSHPQAPDF